MAIPAAVKAQGERADDLIRQHQAAQSSQGDAGSVPPSNTPPQQDTAAGDFRQQYSVLKGKYDAEVPRLHAQTKQLSDALAEQQQAMEALQAELQAARDELSKAQTVKLSAEEQARMEELKGTYGESLVAELEASRARERAAQEELDRLKQTVSDLQQSVGTVAETHNKLTYAEFVKAVKKEIPDAEAINASAEWLRWLGEPDTLTGDIRQSILDRAMQARNAQSAIELFRQFKRRENSAGVPDGIVDVPSNSGPAGAGDERVFTRAEISKFYDDVRRGLYKGREDERAKLERSIEAAAVAGRVR